METENDVFWKNNALWRGHNRGNVKSENGDIHTKRDMSFIYFFISKKMGDYVFEDLKEVFMKLIMKLTEPDK